MELTQPVPFQVTVLGSSGSYASASNPCTGLLLRSGSTAVLLDCGPGTLGPLQRHIDPADLTAIVITHCHPDHWLELPVLRNVFTYFHPCGSMPVYGTARTMEMDHAVTAHPGEPGDPIDWLAIDESSRLTIGEMSFSFSRTDHPVETLAVRVDAGSASFAFTSDTGPAWQASALGEGVDLLIHEASHLSDLEDHQIPHTSARQAGISGRIAGARRLVLTHLVPGADIELHLAEASATFGDTVAYALPDTTFTISTPETS